MISFSTKIGELMNCSLTSHERNYNISLADGFLSTITLFSGAPYSKRHWDLSNKSTACWGHRVIAVLEAIPVIGGLAALIERITVLVYHTFNPSEVPYIPSKQSQIVVAQIRKELAQPSEEPNLFCYEQLSKRMQEGNATLCIADETGENQETLGQVLGVGGSKVAIQISRGKVILLPKIKERDSIRDIAYRWIRMVSEELAVSKVATSEGLLTPQSKLVTVSLAPSVSMPAYVCESFVNLRDTRGWFIIDPKIPQNSTWAEGQSLFKRPEDGLNEANWDLVLDPLLTDIAKICNCHFPVGEDSLNLAVVRNPSSHSVSDYQVRYFGFDFSNKNNQLIQFVPANQGESRDHVAWILGKLTFTLFFATHKDYWDCDKRRPLEALREKLNQKYVPEIMSRMKKENL